MEINERWFKISGKFPVPPGLLHEEDEDVRVTVNGLPFIASVVKTEYPNNQDGTKDEVFILKYFSTIENN